MREVDYGTALWDVRGWADAVGVVDVLEVSKGLIEQSIFNNTVSEKHDFPAGTEYSAHREVAVTWAAVYGVTQRESDTHFGNEAGDDIG